MNPTRSFEVRQLTIGYSDGKTRKSVSEDLSFELFCGELVALIGTNGCGKSTLLRTLAGNLPPLKGEVLFENDSIHRLPDAQRARKLALVLTDRIEIEHLNVYDLVALGRTPYTGHFGRIAPRDHRIIKQVIASVGLQGYEQRKILEMSDGERQRAMIAKALAQDTSVIFLDEPTAHLDLLYRMEILHLLRSLAHEFQKTIVVSTHELELAFQIADRVLLIKKEGIVLDLPEEIVLSGVLSEQFNSQYFAFDYYSGSFRMNHRETRTLQLLSKGEGVYTYWTERLLQRIGFEITAEAELRLTVDERKQSWVLDAGEVSYSLSNLTELSQRLAQL